MRRSKIISLLLACLMAGTALTGCLGGSDDGDDTGDDGTGGSDGGDGTADGGDGGTGGGQIQTRAPMNESLALTMQGGINAIPDSPAPAYGEAGFTVPEDGWVTFTVTVTPQTVEADGVTVKVLDPDGGEQGQASFSFSAEAGDPQEITVSGGAAGDWLVTAQASSLGASAEFDVQVSIAW